MRKSLSDIAAEAHEEAVGKTHASIRSGIFVFKAQLLLIENETLFEQQKYDQVLSNCDRVSGIIARENSMNLLDEIQSMLSQIKNTIKAAAEAKEDVSLLKRKALQVRGDLNEGNLYKSKSDLAELMAVTMIYREENMIGWSRHTGMELNEDLDTIMEFYKWFPKGYLPFDKNPISVLNKKLEIIMYATLTEDYAKMEEKVVDFYNYYYQLERFLIEERKSLGQETPHDLPTIVLKAPPAGQELPTPPTEGVVPSGGQIPPDAPAPAGALVPGGTRPAIRTKPPVAATSERPLQASGQPPASGTAPALAPATGTAPALVSAPATAPAAAPDAAAQPQTPPPREPVIDRAMKELNEIDALQETVDEDTKPPISIEELVDRYLELEESKKEVQPEAGLTPLGVGKEEKDSTLVALTSTLKNKLKIGPKDEKGPVEVPAPRQAAPAAPSTAATAPAPAPAAAAAPPGPLEAKEAKIKALISKKEFWDFCGETKRIDEDDLSRRMMMLEALGFKNSLNSNYGHALVYYNQLALIDPYYKDARKKRAECFDKLPAEIRKLVGA